MLILPKDNYLQNLTKRYNIPEQDSLYRSILILQALLSIYPDWHWPVDSDYEVPESKSYIKAVLTDIKVKTNNFLQLPNTKQVHVEIKLTYSDLNYLLGCLSLLYSKESLLDIDLSGLEISGAILVHDLNNIIKVTKQKYLDQQDWINTEHYYQIAKKINDNDWLLCPECCNAWQCGESIPLTECISCKFIYCNPYYINYVGSKFNKEVAYAKASYLKHDIQDINNVMLFICFEHLLAIYTAVQLKSDSSPQLTQLKQCLFTAIMQSV